MKNANKKIPWNTNKKTPWHAKKKYRNTMEYKTKKYHGL
jgi:hypothetical protein